MAQHSLSDNPCYLSNVFAWALASFSVSSVSLTGTTGQEKTTNPGRAIAVHHEHISVMPRGNIANAPTSMCYILQFLEVGGNRRAMGISVDTRRICTKTLHSNPRSGLNWGHRSCEVALLSTAPMCIRRHSMLISGLLYI